MNTILLYTIHLVTCPGLELNKGFHVKLLHCKLYFEQG